MVSDRKESLSEKPASDQLSSADLPAEFRDASQSGDDLADEAPKEQSKLERLCLQTSSVLASILPAPFGGHKRSVLCQFFGHLPMHSESQRKSTEQQKQVARQIEPTQSVAVLQQHQQPPVSLVASGRHPIQMVLEHQLSQYRLGQRPVAIPAPASPHDLKSSASIIDLAYHTRIDPPRGMTKQASNKVAKVGEHPSKFEEQPTAAFKPITTQSRSQLMSTTGWRILNQTSIQSTRIPQRATTEQAQQGDGNFVRDNSSTSSEGPKLQSKLMTTPSSRLHTNEDIIRPVNASASNSSEVPLSKNITAQIKAQHEVSEGRGSPSSQLDSPTQLLVLGKPPNLKLRPLFESSATTLDKRSEELGTSTRSLGRKLDAPTGVRTIEVMSQNSNATEPREKVQTSTPVVSPRTQTPSADPNQVQKREELVITSINNLTRIAFGNHLRDTVKVINKLIDQQADLFGRATGESVSSADTRSYSGSHKSKLASVTSKKPELGKEQQSPIKPTKRAKKLSVTNESKSQRPSSTDRSTKKQMVRTGIPKISSSQEEQWKSTTPFAVPKRSTRPIIRSQAPSVSSRTTRPMDEFDRIFEGTTVGDFARSRSTSRINELSPSSSSVFSNYMSKAVTSSPKKRNASTPQSASYHWLIPDKGAYQSNSFDPGVSTSASTDSRFATSDPHSKWALGREHDARRQSVKQRPADEFGPNKSEIVKMDSLTTLKMSLTTDSSASQTRSRSQTRWIPTTVITPVPDRTTTTHSPPTQKATSKTTTTTTATTKPLSTIHENLSSQRDESSLATSPMPESKATTRTNLDTQPAQQEDLNEAKASESISRYTTHWNEPNELLATTKQFHQQSMPQLIKTGEFFSAETIASWPERYQAMMSEASGNTRTTPLFETTRREGASYEPNMHSSPRHKATTPVDAEKTRRSESSVSLTTTFPGFTVLPANHKLVATPDIDQFSMTPSQEGANQQTTHWYRDISANGQVPEVAYTHGPHIGLDMETRSTDKQGSIPIDGFSASIPPSKYPVSSIAPRPQQLVTNMSSALKPPYLNPYEESAVSVSDDEATIKQHAPKKLYDLLVPSKQNFVGTQYPLSSQRFNLSMMKFLAQNLLTPASSSNEMSLDNNETDYSQKFLDLFSGGDPFPSNYYELTQNETSEATTNGSTMQGKSFLGRASNFMSDLRQLEHKTAAAILAAIRYQVPSPLVRPWDLPPDNQSPSSPQPSKRLDNSQAQMNLTSNLLLIRAGQAAIRAALAKQRVVPRDELEARLNKDRPPGGQSDRRSDADPLLDILDNGSPTYGNSTDNQQLDYEVALAESLAPANSNSGSRNLSRVLLEKILRPTVKSLIPTLLNHMEQSKYKQMQLESSAYQAEAQPDNAEQRFPKYIRSTNYRSLLSGQKSSEIKSKGLQLPSSIVAAKLQGNISHSGKAGLSNSFEEIRLTTKNTNKEETELLTSNSFDCSNRKAGFYPDVESACQVSCDSESKMYFQVLGQSNY